MHNIHKSNNISTLPPKTLPPLYEVKLPYIIRSKVGGPDPPISKERTFLLCP